MWCVWFASCLPLNFSEGRGQFCRSCVQILLQDEGMKDEKHAACSDWKERRAFEGFGV